MRNRQFVFAPKIQYQLVIKSRTRTSSVRDKLREANQNFLTFPFWCGRRELNPRIDLGRIVYCRYTTPAFMCPDGSVLLEAKQPIFGT